MSKRIVTWPAPESEQPSPDFQVEADGVPVFVYATRVRAEILKNQGLWTHERDCGGERASFAMLDLKEPATVTIRPSRAFKTALVLPHRVGIAAEIAAGSIRFELERAQHLTIVLDGDHRIALHLFIGKPETNVPRPGDPNVIFFGPGVHELETLEIKSGQTVYLAGGAIVRGVLKPGEQGDYSEQWKVRFFGGTLLRVHEASGVRICGRGILDGQFIPHPGRNMVGVHQSSGVRLSGIVLRDAPNWNVLIQQSHDIDVDDLRIVSGRLNSDGINSVNSRSVAIRGCFVRNSDDSIVAKTTEPGAPCEKIRVEDCQIWNDWGFALGATYETRAPIRDVKFSNCSILFSAHFCMGIQVSDSATVSDIAFNGIEIAQTVRNPAFAGARATLTPEPKLIRMAIAQDVWGKDAQRGRIRDIIFEDIAVHGPEMPASDMQGVDAEHAIEHVQIRNVRCAGQPAIVDRGLLRLNGNEYVRDVTVKA